MQAWSANLTRLSTAWSDQVSCGPESLFAQSQGENGRQQALGQTINFFDQNPDISKQLRWQIGFQRELPGGFVVDAAYVGNYGYDIVFVQRQIGATAFR